MSLVQGESNCMTKSGVSRGDLTNRIRGIWPNYMALNLICGSRTPHCDLWYQRHIDWAEEHLGFKPLKQLPSEYIKEHVYWSVQYEKVAVELRHHVGVDRIMFATDFPHIECEWPDTRPLLEEIYASVPEDERAKMWTGNAVEFFRLDRA